MHAIRSFMASMITMGIALPTQAASANVPLLPLSRNRERNKYGHLTWKESRPENTELRHRNEAAREAARKSQGRI